jgi:hypothetical protein
MTCAADPINTTEPTFSLRRELPWALLHLVVAVALFLPVLKGGVFLFGTDTTAQKYLFYQISWEFIQETGRLPLWNPYVFGGIPQLGSFSLCPFFPTTWLMGLLAFPLAFSLHYLLSNFLAGAFTFTGLRMMGVRPFAAAMGGVFFQLTANFASLVYPGHIGKYPAIACFPLVIGGVIWALKRHRPAGFALAGSAVALQLLASHAQIAYYSILTSLAYGLFHFTAQRAWKQPTEWRRMFGGYVLFITVALALPAIQLLPALEMSPRSVRSGGVTFEEAALSSYPPGELGELLFPLYTGDSIIDRQALLEGRREPRRPYFGQWGERLVSNYLGIGVFILALLGVAIGRGGDRWFWLLAAVCALLISCGEYFPVWRYCFRFLPGFSHFRSPATIMFISSFAVVLLAAGALERLWSGELSGRAATKADWLLAAMLCGFVHLALIGNLERSGEAGRLTAGFMRGQALMRTALIGIACTGLLLTTLAFRNRKYGRWFIAPIPIAVCCLIAASDLFLIDRQFVIAAPLKKFEDGNNSLRPLANFLRQTRPGDEPQRLLMLDHELSNLPMMSRLATIRGYHPVMYKRHLEALDAVAINSSVVAQLLGLRYLIADDPQAEAPPGFATLPGFGSRQSVFVRQEPAPYAWFPERVIAMAEGPQMLERTLSLDVLREAVSAEESAVGEYGAATNCSARVVEYSFNRVRLSVESDRERPLLVAEYDVPGWRAVLDGKRELPVGGADYLLRMVQVPAGDHRLEFRYEPDSFRTGGFLSLLTLSLLAGFWGLGCRPGRGRNLRTRPARVAGAPSAEVVASEPCDSLRSSH